ncbi:MAG: mandelate racemase/muconate lactonizing enzyme family protein [Alphaproteobacteria bacterium]|nr:MAG: mandelate racemase/muconate lactonizing enzyme family protein [Alphaproteobacteria bacterium]
MELAQSPDEAKSLRFSIQSVKVEYYRIPLAETLMDAGHGPHTHFELILCRIMGSNGIEGVGYTYTGGAGGRAIATLIEEDLKPRILGRDGSAIEEIWSSMQSELHYVGRGGLLSFAISAVDIALWDMRCIAFDKPLCLVTGTAPRRVNCYAGFIDLNFSERKLVDNAVRHIERGFEAIKTKVGHDDYREDVARVAAIREAIGPKHKLMVDANYSMTVDKAIAFGRAIEPYDIYWFEEPISPDEFEGYGQIADNIRVPLALGENFRIIEEAKRAIRYCRLGFVQPDASNIGGITGWLRVAALARAADIAICSHGMQELHVSLLASQPHAGWLEVHSFPIDRYTKSPLAMEAGKAIAPLAKGTGVVFDDAVLRPHLMYET